MGVTAQAIDAEWLVTGLRAELSPVKANEARLRTVVGTYGEGDTLTEVTLEGGGLFFQMVKGKKHFLIPLAEDLFLVQGADRYGPGSRRAEFVRDAQGRVVKMLTKIRHAPGKIATFEDPKVR